MRFRRRASFRLLTGAYEKRLWQFAFPWMQENAAGGKHGTTKESGGDRVSAGGEVKRVLQAVRKEDIVQA